MRRLHTALVFALVLGTGIFAPVSAPPAAQAAGPSQVLAFANVLGSLLGRNRVYRNAAEVQDDLRAYYDGLRDTARAALRDRELSKLDSQLAAYVRLVASLEYEKNAVLELLEEDKRGARRVFHNDLNRNAPTLLLALPGPRAMAQAVRIDLGEMRDVLQVTRAAISEGPGDALLDVARRRAQLDQLAVVARTIGGQPGRDIAQAIGSLGAQLERLEAAAGEATAEVESGLDEAQRQLTTAIDRLDQQLATEVRPRSVSLFGGLGQVRISGRFAFYAAIAQALSASGGRSHGLTRDEMRERARQFLAESQGAGLANLRDCFAASAAQLRAQLAGADAPEGSSAAALLSTDLSTCDPQAIAAVLAAAAELEPPTTTSPPDDTTPSPTSDAGAQATDGEEWTVGWGDPTTAVARQYVVSTDNVMTTTEGPATYWHPTVGGATAADAPVGTIVYHIPVPGPIVGGEIRMTIATFHWDYSRGSAAIDGSVDGANWHVLADIGPPAFGEANSGGLSGPLPDQFTGAGEIWLRVRLVAWGPQAADGAPWTNTSQHSRSDAGTTADTFRLRVDLAP